MIRCFVRSAIKHFAFVAALLAGALPVRVAEAAASKAQADRAFAEARYEEALALYQELFGSTKRPVFQCHVGRSLHRLGRFEEAAQNLRACLSATALEPRARTEFAPVQEEVEGYLNRAAEVRRYMRPSDTGQIPPAGTPPPSTPAAGVPPQSAPGAAQGPPAMYSPPPGSLPSDNPNPAQGAGQVSGQSGPAPWMQPRPADGPPSIAAKAPEQSSNTAAYLVGGAGLAAAVTGAVFGFQARSLFGELESRYDMDKESTSKRYNIMQFVGFGVGAAGITAAIIMLASGGDSGDGDVSSRPGRLAIDLNPTGVSLRGAF